MACERSIDGKFVKGHSNLFRHHTKESKRKISRSRERPIDQSVLHSMYIIKKMTMLEIANELNICRGTVSKYLHQFNIDTNTHRFTIQPDFENRVDIAYVLGVLHGDGSISLLKKRRQYIVTLTVKDILFVKSFKASLVRLKLNPSICRDRSYYKLSATSKLLYHFIKVIKLDRANLVSYCNTVATKVQFIRGFYESEGHDRGRGRGLLMFNTDKTTLDVVKLFLSDSLDIYAHYSTTHITEGKKDVYRLYIPAKYKAHFFKKVKPVIKRKQ